MSTLVQSTRRHLYDFSREELTTFLAGQGFSAYHSDLVWSGLYRDQAGSIAAMADLRPALRRLLAPHATNLHLPVADSANSRDGFTRKFLLRLADRQLVETVLMRFKGRATVCVSTQVGCAMGCVFCATGQMGFYRHLTQGEIVAQVMHVSRELHEEGQKLRNIVLMGMGEPLHNYEATMAAVETMMDHRGLAIAPRHITVSTVGVVPGIRRLADEQRPINLAVSLHAATDEERQALVPPGRRWPLAVLMEACRYYIARRGRRIFFEWTLIAGQNDGPEQAHAVGRLLQGLEAHLNLIPLNPVAGYAGQPSHESAVKQFQVILTQYNLPSTVRQRRGIDIGAGCGQLRSDHSILD